MTASPIDAAHQLLAEFRERGSTPALWLIDAFTLEQIKGVAGGAYVRPSMVHRQTLLGLPFLSGEGYDGLELLNLEAAIAGGHIAPQQAL